MGKRRREKLFPDAQDTSADGSREGILCWKCLPCESQTHAGSLAVKRETGRFNDCLGFSCCGVVRGWRQCPWHPNPAAVALLGAAGRRRFENPEQGGQQHGIREKTLRTGGVLLGGQGERCMGVGQKFPGNCSSFCQRECVHCGHMSLLDADKKC